MVRAPYAASVAEDAFEDVIAGWQEFAGSLGDREVPPSGAVIEDARSIIARVGAEGWFDLATELPPTVLAECLRRSHRLEHPLPAPLVEHFTALLALTTITSDGDGALTSMSDQVRSGARVCSVAPESLVAATGRDPRAKRHGWVPFGEHVPHLQFSPARDGGVSVLAVEPGEAEMSAATCPDVTLRVARRALTHAPPASATVLGRLDPGQAATLLDRLLILQAASLVGQAEGLLQRTIDYLKVREQFGVPIGSFQAIKHRVVDITAVLHAAATVFRDAAQHSVTSSSLGPGLLAKSIAGRAAHRVASEAVQLYGGIGFTWEGGVHFSLKRVAYLCMSAMTPRECEAEWGRQLVEREGGHPWPSFLGATHEV